MSEKAAILFSGGVDSAVAALLMKKRGFDVCGFFMDIGINSKDAINHAFKMAEALDIELEIVDVSKEFEKAVIDYFKKEYSELRTPNPCVVCNQFIKFGVLYDEIRKRGFERIITGHYIKKSKIKSQKSKVLEYKLYKAKDEKKDQSYFLYNLAQEQLKYLEFPLGGITKKEVIEIAKENNIKIPEEESQDICFLQGDHNKYLEEYLDLKRGPIVNKKGDIIGEHFGLPLYTIGQRRWIKIGGTGPYYVLRTDIKTNTLFVTDHFDDEDLYNDEFEIIYTNWVGRKTWNMEPSFAKATEDKHGTFNNSFIKIKIRYLYPAVEVKSIEQKDDGKYIVKLKGSQRAITPGQSAVFYSEEELLGGGVINRTLKIG